MAILSSSGLLPLLKSIQKPCNLKKFAGQTLGVDAYGWLHRGAVACAIDIALEKPTNKFVEFSMHRVRMLIHFGVVPYMVFDGDNLPSKAATEAGREKRREESRKLGLELYRLGKPSQAHLELQKAVDVTPEMARQLIDELKKLGVQYVVAPYEADAQLAYLEKKDIIQGIISEDSDLLVFGAKRLLTKLDQYGDCVEISRNDFTACREISLVGWTDTEFRRMAILSGCDYLASVNKLGLKTAYRLVRKYKTIEKILRMLSFDGQYRVPPGYAEAFERAELTFLYQRVFCPLASEIVGMHNLSEDLKCKDLSFMGSEIKRDIAIGIAQGDLHPTTKRPLIVRRSVNCTESPRTPWVNARKQPEGLPSSLKNHKPIEAFFKAKRTPLAELDPNNFTPSPSQQRLLQQNNGVWVSTPTHDATMLSHPNRSAQAPSRPSLTRGERATSCLSVPHSSKRRRLCSDLCEEDTTSTPLTAGSEQSPYFARSMPKRRPSITTGRKKREQRTAEIQIWSDDSIEDALAQLPDVWDGQSQTPSKTIKIFNDEAAKKGYEESVELYRFDVVQAHSQSSTNPAVGELSCKSSTKVATSEADYPKSKEIAKTTDRHVPPKLASWRREHLHQPDTNERGNQLPLIKATPTNAEPSSSGHESMTPLQRLGNGALNRSRSSSSAFHVQARSRATPAAPAAIGKKANAAVEEGSSLSTLSHPNLAAPQGSEDAIIPLSEPDSEGASEPDESLKPGADLKPFAFAG
ncbi:MAG: hypothetical protein Q9167_005001 [Letrouitia subvulpina]